jgi:putative transport protein
VPDENLELQTGDIIEVVCSREQFDDLAMLVGDISEHNFKDSASDLSFRSIAATQKEALKKTIAQLDFPARLGVNITKIERAGVEFMPRPSMKLCFGDNVTAVGSKEALDKASDELGNSEKDLAHPNIMPIFIGITIGIIVGCIPVQIPGLSAPVKLGIAGGPLLVAVILGRIRRIGPLNWHLPMGPNLMLREVGITLFLACVGLKSGGSFIHTIMDGQGVYWMLLGVIITAIPLLTVALISRLIFKKNFLSICGLLAGSCTDPPALSFAYQMSESEAPVISYATVYALTMFLRIITAQLFVIIFSSF